MTLREYLTSPQAVEDVKALLASEPTAGPLRTRSAAACMWSARESGPWTRVETWAQSPAGRVEFLNCYYHPDDDRFMVSDCGESVSAIMRRTGKSWQESLKILHRAECLAELKTERDGDIMLDGVNDLAQAIVTVLAIIAKTRETQP